RYTPPPNPPLFPYTTLFRSKQGTLCMRTAFSFSQIASTHITVALKRKCDNDNSHTENECKNKRHPVIVRKRISQISPSHRIDHRPIRIRHIRSCTCHI